MRIIIFLLFIFISIVGSAQVPAGQSLAPQIDKLTKVIADLKCNNGDAANGNCVSQLKLK